MEAAEVAAVVGMMAECLDAEDDDEHEGITEESVAELMSWFELEIKLAAAGANALPLPLPPTAAALYAAVSERNESCGSSLSAPASTVMASVDGRAAGGAEPWPWTWPVPKPAAAGEEEEEEEVVDDEWVSQLLTDGPPVEGHHGGQ
ncbi:hypothetical protein BDA96_09G077600 [Sorghum bicolor]|uniref:Uncharacterized protein n=2 Tax=Sorghum bicolor TaxID=4558 RepID=A0A921U3E9_SORBI|nr:hypothetical protein BDA96_09G077600 [Sorghum bicolor]KXG21508.1 hypothetical protein SORBI_3009G073200 [Sorghum bicolor]